jgi:hypothetical protein
VIELAHRLLFFHKQKTSARTRFLRLPQGVVAFSPLPADAELRPDAAPAAADAAPAALLAEALQRFELAAGQLRVEEEFFALVDTPAGAVRVWLIEFTTLDPPFAAVERAGARFIPITEARGLPAIELALLARAYEVLIG